MDLSGELARTLLDLAPDPTVIVDAEGTIVFANAQVEHAFGLRRHGARRRKGRSSVAGAFQRNASRPPRAFRVAREAAPDGRRRHAVRPPQGRPRIPDRDQLEPRRDGGRSTRRRGRSRRHAAARQRGPARRREQAEEPVPRRCQSRPAPAAPDPEPAEPRSEAPSRRERLHARSARAATARARLDVRVACVGARHQQARQRQLHGESDGLRDRRGTRELAVRLRAAGRGERPRARHRAIGRRRAHGCRALASLARQSRVERDPLHATRRSPNLLRPPRRSRRHRRS